MSEPVFLEIEQILKLHQTSLKLLGGSPGLRDHGLLEGAVMQPRQDYFYAQADHFGIAAAYAFHIAQVQAFLDGNKRTAIAAALVFLEMHGHDTTCDWQILHDSMISIAEKRLDKEGLGQVLRENFG